MRFGRSLTGCVAICLACISLPSVSAAACLAGDDAYLLDWNDPAASWPGSGALSDAVIVPRAGSSIGDPDSRELIVTINISGATNRIGSAYPNVSTQITGGYASTEKSLSIKQDLASTSESNTISLSFERPVYDLSFEIFDVDQYVSGGQGFIDRVTVTGLDARSGATRSATQARTPRPSSLTSSVVLATPGPDSVEGVNFGGYDDEGYGNVRFTFSQPVTSVDIIYENAIGGDPVNQGMALYDLSFCTDPAEISASKKVNFATRVGGLCADSDATRSAAVPGQCMKYIIEARNTGGETAEDVTILDQLPGNVTLIDVDNLSFDDSDPDFTLVHPPFGTDCSTSACVVEMRNGRLAAGARGRLRIVVRID